MREDDKYNLIWTGLCFVLIIILTLIFKNANTLWLLILWYFGLSL